MRETPCTRCRTPLPGDARFCIACGAPAPQTTASMSKSRAAPAPPQGQPPAALPADVLLPPGFVPSDQGMPVCLGCGVIAPQQGSACMVCELDLPSASARAAVAAASAGRFWVAVRCGFQCRACGHMSPLNHLAMDGSAACLRCGMSQIFDVDSWDEGLAHAHAVGDLAGPAPEGRFPDARAPIGELNPFRELGRSETSSVLQQSGVVIEGGMMTNRSLRVEASPGHPLCGLCRAPLAVTGASGSALSVRCTGCGDSATYDLPARAAERCRGLRGVLADEHRAGSRQASLERSGAGVEILRCPNCAGALSVSGASTVVDCEYCHVALRIPMGALHRLGHREPRPLVWWLLFEGPSPARRALLRKRRKAAKRGRAAAERRQPPEARFAVAAGSQADERAQPAARSGGLGSMLVAAAVTGLVGYAGFRDDIAGWFDAGAAWRPDTIIEAGVDAVEAIGAAGAAGTREETGAQGASGTPSWAGDRSSFTTLPGCTCNGRTDKKRPAGVKLAVQVYDRGWPGAEPPDIALAYYLDVGPEVGRDVGTKREPSAGPAGEVQSFPLLAGEGDAPPVHTATRLLGIGMACSGDTVAIAAGEQVTGWSLSDGSKRWSVTLDQAYRHEGEPARSGINIACERLSLRKGRVRVPTGARRKISIDMRNGRVQR